MRQDSVLTLDHETAVVPHRRLYRIWLCLDAQLLVQPAVEISLHVARVLPVCTQTRNGALDPAVLYRSLSVHAQLLDGADLAQSRSMTITMH